MENNSLEVLLDKDNEDDENQAEDDFVMPEGTVYIYEPAVTYKLACPLCGASQKKDRTCCFQCGTKFEFVSDINLIHKQNQYLINEIGVSINPEDQGINGNFTGSGEAVNEIEEKFVYLYKPDVNGKIICPVCHASQKNDRECCFQCGIKFVLTDDESKANMQSSRMVAEKPATSLNGNYAVSTARKTELSLLGQFRSTKWICGSMDVDEKSRIIKLTETTAFWNKRDRYYKYEDIIGYELIVNNGIATKGGLRGAIGGGLLLGGVGVIAGSVIGKKNYSICDNMVLRVTVNDSENPMVSIHMINGQIKTDSMQYRSIRKKADEMISQLQYICSLNESQSRKQQEEVKTGSSFSPADEVMKLKRLLDEGIITQSEFDKKKKELLGL